MWVTSLLHIFRPERLPRFVWNFEFHLTRVWTPLKYQPSVLFARQWVQGNLFLLKGEQKWTVLLLYFKWSCDINSILLAQPKTTFQEAVRCITSSSPCESQDRSLGSIHALTLVIMLQCSSHQKHDCTAAQTLKTCLWEFRFFFQHQYVQQRYATFHFSSIQSYLTGKCHNIHASLYIQASKTLLHKF